MADVLAPLGYVAAETADDADMVILNTCHIREKAAEKVFSELGRLRALQSDKASRGGRMILAVAGCVAQAEGAEIIARAPYVDIVLGPQTYHRLPEMVASATRAAGGVLDTEFPAEAKFDFLPEATAGRSAAALLTIQEGCDKFCTFCVVPYTRGAEFSRPAADVIAEARRLVGHGAREITLLGQNVNAYHGAAPDGGDWGLARLIRALADLPGLERIRYMTSHPRDMDDALIAAHRDVTALMPFLHLPVQSGSDRILAAMNRGHTVAELSPHDGGAAPGARRSRLLLGFHRGLSRRERGGFRRPPSISCARSDSPRPIPSSTAPGPARRRPRSRIRCRSRSRSERLARLQELLQPSSAPSAEPRRQRPAGAVRAARPASGPARRAAAPSCSRCTPGSTPASSAPSCRCASSASSPTASQARRWRRRRGSPHERRPRPPPRPRHPRPCRCSSTTTRCCRRSSASTMPISTASRSSSASPWSPAATASPSPAPARGRIRRAPRSPRSTTA